MKEKIVICFFGVISRSIRYTHANLKSMLIDITKRYYDVDIYIFNNDIENTPIDSTIVNNNDKYLLEANFIEEEKQTSINMKIKTLVQTKKINCTMRRDYTPTWINNSIRQMYSEEKVGVFLEKNKEKYKCAVVCGPDYFLLNQIKIQHIQNSINNKSFVYTTNVNDANGYTNGLYIGSPEPLVKILKRFSILDQLLPTDKDYEYLLKRVFEINNIDRHITETKFFKIRSNKTVARQGIMRHPFFNQVFQIVSNHVKNIN
jgi:hypothetical protein